MPIYNKSTRLLMKDFVTESGVVKGQILTRNQIESWFKTNYPKIKRGTISAHLIHMSTNAPSRVHYNVNPNGEDDLFFQVDGSHFRLFDSNNDPTPIYSRGEAAEADVSQLAPSVEMEDVIQPSEFAYERDLRNFLARNLGLIEPGLRLYEQEGITGVEYPVGGRLVDILAIDANDNYVVIELKVSRGYDRVIGQLLRYIGWIEINHAEPHQRVRGIIIAREITEDLLLASSKISDVELYEYELSITLSKKNKG